MNDMYDNSRPTYLTGRVLTVRGGFYQVQTERGPLACRLRGRLKRAGFLPELEGGVTVGDVVRVSPIVGDSDVAAGMVEAVEPRRNLLPRPRIANIDQCIAVLAAREPLYDLLLLDKILLTAAHYGINAVICFNKADLAGADLEPLAAAYRQAGFTVIFASARYSQGVAELQTQLSGKTSVLAGPSGVGKSSLLNMLMPQYQARVGEISARLQRGKHTTRHVSLLPLAADGLVADTPGFSLLDLPADLEAERLAQLYPEYAALAENCRFLGCLHRHEPGCAVKRELAAGRLDEGRYQRYLRLLTEVEEREVKY